MANDRNTGSATGKAFAIVEAMARAQRALSAVELGVELGLNRQTIHRMLAQLQDEAIIQRDIYPERYRLAPRFDRMALQGLSSRDPASLMRAILLPLVEEIGETCNVGVIDGHEISYVARVECDWPLRVQLQAGSRVPAYCTAIGKLMLSTLDAAQLAAYLEAVPLKALNENTIHSEERLRAHLGDIRERGYAVNDQEDSIGLLAIAVPVLDADGTIVAGLSLHGLEARFPVARALETVPTLRGVSTKLSEALFTAGRDIGPDAPQ